MAMAAESFMNLSPWDYYLQVQLFLVPSLCLAGTAIALDICSNAVRSSVAGCHKLAYMLCACAH